MKPTPFSKLQDVSLDGPVVVIDISQYRSDAIVITSTAPPLAIPLPDATPSLLQDLATSLGPRPAQAADHSVIIVLRELWRVIVNPVVDILRGESIAVPLGSRIWWCSTAEASWLPIHAAGTFIAGERDLPNLFISSYTPTLGGLIRAE